MSHSQERRLRTSASLRARTSSNGGTVVEGYALTYGTRTLIGRGKGSFHEVLSQGAARKALSKSDIRLLFNHQGMPLARTKSGTLSLREDSKGVFFSAQLDADSPDAQALASATNRGDIDGCSFSFTMPADGSGEEWTDYDCGDEECCGQRGSVLRTINEIGEMFDLGPVSFPAYPGTSVSGQQVEDLSQNVAFAGAVVPSEVRNRAEQIIEQRSRKPRLSDSEWLDRAVRRMVAADLAIRSESTRAYSVSDAVDDLGLRSQTALDAAHAEDVRFAEADRIVRQAARWLAAPHTFPGDCASFLRWQADWFRS